MEPNPRYLATWPEPTPVERRASLRPKEIAAMHGIGRSTVYGAIYRGELRTKRAGRAHVVPVEEVERWLREGARTNADE